MTNNSRKVWQAHIYVANRFGSMVEKTLEFPGSLTKVEAEVRVNGRLDILKRQGVAVYPQFDLEQVAA